MSFKRAEKSAGWHVQMKRDARVRHALWAVLAGHALPWRCCALRNISMWNRNGFPMFVFQKKRERNDCWGIFLDYIFELLCLRAVAMNTGAQNKDQGTVKCSWWTRNAWEISLIWSVTRALCATASHDDWSWLYEDGTILKTIYLSTEL